ncbi:hypothetical protein PI125_g25696 [Phytophthora idaei]|nr:hypothetical protein PI125_g25696 [Phytophthora idaei]
MLPSSGNPSMAGQLRPSLPVLLGVVQQEGGSLGLRRVVASGISRTYLDQVVGVRVRLIDRTKERRRGESSGAEPSAVLPSDDGPAASPTSAVAIVRAAGAGSVTDIGTV